MDPATRPTPLGIWGLYCPPIWVMLSAVIISISTGVMVWHGVA